jgi:hypothetical protein
VELAQRPTQHLVGGIVEVENSGRLVQLPLGDSEGVGRVEHVLFSFCPALMSISGPGMNMRMIG